MAFTDMNDVEQELGEEKPPQKNSNRTFMIIAGILGGIMVLALLCIAGLAIFRYLPGQRAAQFANETNVAKATEVALSASQTALAPVATSTRRATAFPTNTQIPTKTAVIVLGPTKTPTIDIAKVTRIALLTQAALTAQATLTPLPTLALPPTATAKPTQAVQATSTTAPTKTSAPTQTAKPTQTAQATQTKAPTSTAQATQTKQPTVTTPATKTALPSATPLQPTTTALPTTGIAEDLGMPGLITLAFFLLAVIFLVRRIRTAS